MKDEGGRMKEKQVAVPIFSSFILPPSSFLFARLNVDRLLHHVKRPTLAFGVSASDVFTEDADADAVKSDGDEQQDYDGRDAGRRRTCEPEKRIDEGRDHREREDDRAHQGKEPQGAQRETGNRAEDEKEQLKEWRLALSGLSGLTLIFDAHLPKSKPGDKPAHVAVLLRATLKRVAHLSGNQAKVEQDIYEIDTPHTTTT